MSEQVTKADYEALAMFRASLRKFLRFSEEAARSEGLTPRQHQLMLAVKGQEGRAWASVSEIAESLQVRHNAAVGLVNRCVSAGLVKRIPSSEDRRQVHVVLMPKGETILERLSYRHMQELRALRHTLRLPFLEEERNTEIVSRG